MRVRLILGVMNNQFYCRNTRFDTSFKKLETSSECNVFKTLGLNKRKR